jgi:hypothetical protein
MNLPFLHAAMTKEVPETKNIGAAIKGSDKLESNFEDCDILFF